MINRAGRREEEKCPLCHSVLMIVSEAKIERFVPLKLGTEQKASLFEAPKIPVQ